MRRNRKLGFDKAGGEYDGLMDITTPTQIWGRFWLRFYDRTHLDQEAPNATPDLVSFRIRYELFISGLGNCGMIQLINACGERVCM